MIFRDAFESRTHHLATFAFGITVLYEDNDIVAGHGSDGDSRSIITITDPLIRFP